MYLMYQWIAKDENLRVSVASIRAARDERV